MFILFIYPEFDHILYILYTYYIWLMSMYDCCTMYLDCHRGFDCLKCKYLQSPQNLRPTISQPLLLKKWVSPHYDAPHFQVWPLWPALKQLRPVPCNKAANRLSSPANQDGKRIFFEVGTVSSKQQRGVSPSQPANFFLKFLGLNGLKFTISVVIFGGSRNIQILKKLKGTIPRLNDDRPQKIMR